MTPPNDGVWSGVQPPPVKFTIWVGELWLWRLSVPLLWLFILWLAVSR